MTEAERTTLLRDLLQSLIDAVKVAGDLGAPAGTMYAALMDKLQLNQFQALMSCLVAAGRLRRSGNLYFFVADL